MVWCATSLKVPTIPELQKSKVQFIEKNGYVILSGLEPKTMYTAYCYVEGMNQIAMNVPIAKTAMTFETEIQQVVTENTNLVASEDIQSPEDFNHDSMIHERKALFLIVLEDHTSFSYLFFSIMILFFTFLTNFR